MRARLKSLAGLLKANFFAGVLVGLPLGVIGMILVWLLETLWGVQDVLPSHWRPNHYINDTTLAWLLNVLIVGGLSLLLAFGISLLGWISKHFMGKAILEFLSENIIQKIPVVRSIYSALDQLMRTFAAGGGSQFNRVVYVEYPRKGSWSLAFVTSSVSSPPAPKPPVEGDKMLNIFIPTTPNPTSGFLITVPESEVIDAHMKVEDAFKSLLSLGIAQPGSFHKS